MQLNFIRSYSAWIVLIFLIFICPYGGTQEIPKGNLSVLVSPISIVPDQTFRILVTSEKPFALATVKVNGPNGSLDVLKQREGGGPPYWWIVTFRAEEAGIHQVWFENGTSRLIEKTFSINLRKQTRNTSSYIWQTERASLKPYHSPKS